MSDFAWFELSDGKARVLDDGTITDMKVGEEMVLSDRRRIKWDGKMTIKDPLPVFSGIIIYVDGRRAERA